MGWEQVLATFMENGYDQWDPLVNQGAITYNPGTSAPGDATAGLGSPAALEDLGYNPQGEWITNPAEGIAPRVPPPAIIQPYPLPATRPGAPVAPPTQGLPPAQGTPQVGGPVGDQIAQQIADPNRTAETLRRYLEDPDNAYLVLNHSLNRLRDAGASSHFTNWFAMNFNSFLGEYQGLLAQQALAGEVPNVSFVDFVLGMNLDQRRAAGSQPSQPGTLQDRSNEYAQTAGAIAR